MIEYQRLADLQALTYQARIMPDSFDSVKRTFEAVLSHQHPVEVFSFRVFDIIDELLLVRGFEFEEKIPLLDSHERNSIEDQIGSISNMRVDGKDFLGTLHLSETERAEIGYKLVRSGDLDSVSVGYRILRREEIEKGTFFEIDGERFDGPLEIAHQTRIFEASLLPIGADEKAKIRKTLPISANFKEIQGKNIKLEKELKLARSIIKRISD